MNEWIEEGEGKKEGSEGGEGRGRRGWGMGDGGLMNEGFKGWGLRVGG